MGLEVNSSPSTPPSDSVGSAAIIDGSVLEADLELDQRQETPTGAQATGTLLYWNASLGRWASNPDGVKLRSAVLNRIFIPGVNGEINFGSGTIEGSTDARISRAGDRHLDFVSTSITVSGGSAPLFGVYTGSLKAAGGDVGLVSSHLMQAESGDTEPRTMLHRTTGIWFGSGAAAVDTNLYRNAADSLKTDDDFTANRLYSTQTNVTVSSSGQIAFSSTFSPNTFPSWRVQGGGTLQWGDGTSIDTNLYRTAANQLQSDDSLIVLDGVATKVKAGVPVDGDFATTPVSGTMVVDTTNSRLYVRVGATWKFAALV